MTACMQKLEGCPQGGEEKISIQYIHKKKKKHPQNKTGH